MNWSKVLDILKVIGKYLLKAFKWAFGNIKNLIIVVLAILFLVAACNAYSTKKELEKTKIELVEANDSTFTYKNKVGELYAARETYIADIKQLKEENAELYQEYKHLKDHPIIIEKVETIIKIDSITVKDSVALYNDTYIAKFDYNDKWYNISGATSFDLPKNTASTSIFNVSLPANFTTDVIEKDKKLYFLTKCDNPYVQINNIEGAVVSPEQSKVLKNRFDKPWGIMIGVGPSVTVIDNTVKVYPALQLTLGYKFISF